MVKIGIHFLLGLYNNKVSAFGSGSKISNGRIEYDKPRSQTSLRMWLHVPPWAVQVLQSEVACTFNLLGKL